jgi:hypothetical protein
MLITQHLLLANNPKVHLTPTVQYEYQTQNTNTKRQPTCQKLCSPCTDQNERTKRHKKQPNPRRQEPENEEKRIQLQRVCVCPDSMHRAENAKIPR